MEKTYTVYCHTNKENGKKYVGITCQDVKRRWERGCTYKESPRFYNAIQHYGWDNFTHEIIETGLPKADAEERERYYIKTWDTKSPNGYNLDSGGNANKEWSAESKAKRSKNISGVHNPFYGKTHSKESKEKIAASRRGKPSCTHTQEFKDALAKRRSRRVLCVETNRVYDSQADAGRQLGLSRGTICEACTGRKRTAGGYHWMYYDEGREVV